MATLRWFPPVQLVVAWITLFVVGTDLFVVSPLLPSIARQLQTDASQAGLLVTVFSLGYLLAAPVFGHVADRFGRRRVMLHCLCAFAVANLLTALTANFPELLVVRLACGISAAGVTPSVYALVGDAAPADRRSTWIAVAVTGLLSALPLGATAGAWLGSMMGWATIFALLGCFALLLVVANTGVWSAQHNVCSVQSARADASWMMPLARALLPTIAWSSALYGMYTYLGAGLTLLGYGAQQIAVMVFVYGVAAFAGALIGGRTADRVGPRLAVQMSLASLAIAFAIMGNAARSRMGLGAAVALTSIAAQTFFPAQQALLITAFSERRSAALSWNNSALFLGITLGSLVGGRIMDAGGFAAIPTMSVALTLAGLLACSPKPADVRHAEVA